MDRKLKKMVSDIRVLNPYHAELFSEIEYLQKYANDMQMSCTLMLMHTDYNKSKIGDHGVGWSG